MTPLWRFVDSHLAGHRGLEKHVHQVPQRPDPLGHVLAYLSKPHFSSSQKVEELSGQEASHFTGSLGCGYLILKPVSELIPANFRIGACILRLEYHRVSGE